LQKLTKPKFNSHNPSQISFISTIQILYGQGIEKPFKI